MKTIDDDLLCWAVKLVRLWYQNLLYNLLNFLMKYLLFILFFFLLNLLIYYPNINPPGVEPYIYLSIILIFFPFYLPLTPFIFIYNLCPFPLHPLYYLMLYHFSCSVTFFLLIFRPRLNNRNTLNDITSCIEFKTNHFYIYFDIQVSSYFY